MNLQTVLEPKQQGLFSAFRLVPSKARLSKLEEFVPTPGGA